MAQENPFATPEAHAVARPEGTWAAGWFAVGPTKVLVLTTVTLGFYAIYWFERQYRMQKRFYGEDTWPLARGVFSVFYAIDLFRRVRALSSEQIWSADAMGWLYLGCAIVARVVDRLTMDAEAGLANGLATLTSMALLGGMGFVLSQVQGHINAELDRVAPRREKNERFTVVNWLLIAAGSALIALGLAGSFFGMEG